MPKFNSKLRRKQLDKLLSGHKNVPKLPYGYIHEIRNSLEMTTRQLARRLGVSQPSVISMEQNERNGSITLKSLELAAEALGCTVVYALVPKQSLEEIVQEQAKLKAQEIVKSVDRTMALEKQSTKSSEQQELVKELAAEIVHKGGSGLWKTVDDLL